MNIEKQLAAALRAVIDTAPGGVRANEANNIAAKRDGILALAAYDAQQAVAPGDGAWVAEPITNVISAPPIRGRAYREPVASCNSAEYAERITACVNACAGMTTAEVLEFGAPGELGRCAQAWVAEDNDNA